MCLIALLFINDVFTAVAGEAMTSVCIWRRGGLSLPTLTARRVSIHN